MIGSRAGAGRSPRALTGRPNRRTTVVMRPWEWALPPSRVDLEVRSEVPEGWTSAPRDDRRPPLLFIHGAGAGAWVFAEHWLSAAARRGYPAHALSLRGHGESGGTDRLARTLLRDYVHDVMAVITELPEPPVLVGHGMGALLAQEVAQRYPARGMVLITPAPADGLLGNLAAQVRRRPRDYLGAALLGRSPVRPEVMFSYLDQARGEAYVRRWGRESPLVLLEMCGSRSVGPVRCPVGVVGATEDALVRPADVKHTAAMYGVRPMWLPGAGHQVMLDSGHTVNLDLILDWVDAQAPVGALSPAALEVR